MDEGPRGEFYVDLAVQYPALMRLTAQRPGMAWLLEYIDKPDMAAGQARARLGQLMSALPPEHPCARPGNVDEWKFSRQKALRSADRGAGLLTAEDFLADMGQRATAAQQRIRDAVAARDKRTAG